LARPLGPTALDPRQDLSHGATRRQGRPFVGRSNPLQEPWIRICRTFRPRGRDPEPSAKKWPGKALRGSSLVGRRPIQSLRAKPKHVAVMVRHALRCARGGATAKGGGQPAGARFETVCGNRAPVIVRSESAVARSPGPNFLGFADHALRGARQPSQRGVQAGNLCRDASSELFGRAVAPIIS